MFSYYFWGDEDESSPDHKNESSTSGNANASMVAGDLYYEFEALQKNQRSRRSRLGFKVRSKPKKAIRLA